MTYMTCMTYKKYGGHTVEFLANKKHLYWCRKDAENKHIIIYIKGYPCWRQLSRSPRIQLEVKIGACLGSDFSCDLPQCRKENYGTKMAAAGRDPAVMVGVVGVPSSGIELVLRKNYLP
jgi:hypothetical protein